MKKSMLFICSLALTGAVFADASIDSVIVRQQWPWNNKVNIDFVLTDPDSNTHDISLVLKNGTQEIPYDREDVLGEFENLAPGAHRLVWNPSKVEAKMLDSLTATITFDDDPKKYLVFDLTGGYSPTGQIPYEWRSRPPAEGWFQSDKDYTYRGDYVVFRRIKAGSFVMGSPETEPGRDTVFERQIPVTLTKDFYIGIIPITALQVKNIYNTIVPMDGYAPSDYAPLMFVSIDYLRGADWTEHRPKVGNDSVCGVFNARTAALWTELPGCSFDVPTAAQWEYACRAGTTTAHYNGTDVNTLTDPDKGQRNTDQYDLGLADIAQYKYNTKLADGSAGVQFCGGSKPNAWGLYHMLGGPVWEVVRDEIQYQGQTLPKSAVVSADGDISAAGYGYFFKRGGDSLSECGKCRAASWSGQGYTNSRGSFQSYSGVRLCITFKGE